MRSRIISRIDPASYRSLEIDRTVAPGGVEGSLFSAIDRTPRRWEPIAAAMAAYPLCDQEHIEARQAAIAALLESPPVLRSIAQKLEDVCDIERIVGRLAVGRAMPAIFSTFKMPEQAPGAAG